MASKIFVKSFEQFGGLDYRRSSLTDSFDDAETLTNYKFGEGYSLTGRNGRQMIGQPGGFVGHHSYAYFDNSTGATIQEEIAINDNLWRLRSTSLVVTRTGGSTTWGYRVYLDSATNTFKFELEQGGVQALLVDLGHGMELAPYTILDLRDAIDALANFSCAMPTRTARADGAQNNVSTIVVDAGHTFAVEQECSLWDHTSGQFYLKSLYIAVAGATALTGIFGVNTLVSVLDNQVLGIGAVPAATIPVGELTLTSTDPTQNIPFSYWDVAPHSTEVYSVNPLLSSLYPNFNAPFKTYYAQQSPALFKPPSFLNANNSVYIGTDCLGHVSSPDYDLDQQVYRYDSQAVYRVGLPRPSSDIVTVTDSGAGAIPDGTYKYMHTYVFTDASGIEIESEPLFPAKSVTLAGGGSTASYTLAGPSFPDSGGVVNGAQAGVTTIVVTAPHDFNTGDIVRFLRTGPSVLWIDRLITATTLTSISINGSAIDVADLTVLYKNPRNGFRHNADTISPTQTNVNTFTTVNAFQFRVGDTVYLKNTTTGELNEYKRSITALALASITVDGDPVKVVVSTQVSTIAARIYRTQVGGNVFYLNAVLPVPSQIPITYVDNLLDSQLREQYIESEIGKERDLPPKASIACLHQGLVVYSGIKDNPNTVAFSDSVGGPEAVPLASNYFDIPSNITGAIAAVGSDSEDRLAVFKDTAYYDVPGDLDSNNFTVRAVREGDYGISSHASLVKVNGNLIGVGRLGFLGVFNGDIVPEVGDKIAPAIWNNSNLRLHQAVATNDYTSRRYSCYIPSTEGFGVAATSDNALLFYFDYQNDGKWFNGSYNGAIAPSGGFAVYDNNLHHLSRNYGGALDNAYPGLVFRELMGLSDPTQQYADHHLPITYTWTTVFDSLGEPSIDKEPLWLSVYSMAGSFETPVAFDVLVSSFRNYSYLTVSSQATLSFNGTTDYKERFKLKADKSASMAYTFVTNAIGQCPFITGLEIIIAASYNKDTPIR